jgi:rod shape-determining protein MreC
MPKRRLNLFFILLILATLVIIIFSKFGFINFASNLVQNTLAPVQSVVRGIFVKDIDSQKSESIELALKIVDQQKLIEDNAALRNQFEATAVKSQSLIPAKIVGSPGFIPGLSVPEVLVINVGRADGVKEGQAVVYKDNLIGVIEKANENFSKVVLVNSSDFNLTVKTLNEGAAGVVKGSGGGQMILDNVLLSQNLTENQLVVSRGSVNENGVGILPNLILGKITSVNKNASNLFQTAKVEPLVDPGSLSTVFVIVKQ